MFIYLYLHCPEQSFIWMVFIGFSVNLFLFLPSSSAFPQSSQSDPLKMLLESCHSIAPIILQSKFLILTTGTCGLWQPSPTPRIFFLTHSTPFSPGWNPSDLLGVTQIYECFLTLISARPEFSAWATSSITVPLSTACLSGLLFFQFCNKKSFMWATIKKIGPHQSGISIALSPSWGDHVLKAA